MPRPTGRPSSASSTRQCSCTEKLEASAVLLFTYRQYETGSQWGARTIDTRDGANIEIGQTVDEKNIFFFGNTADEVLAAWSSGDYSPRSLHESQPGLGQALDMMREGYFSPDDPGRSLLAIMVFRQWLLPANLFTRQFELCQTGSFIKGLKYAQIILCNCLCNSGDKHCTANGELKLLAPTQSMYVSLTRSGSAMSPWWAEKTRPLARCTVN